MPSKPMLKLRNDFHQTEALVRAARIRKVGEADHDLLVDLQVQAFSGDHNAARRLRAAEKRMCGIGRPQCFCTYRVLEA